MFTPTGTARIFLATGATDMRRGFASLYGLIVQHGLGDPLDGTLYGFCNRRRDMLKVMYFADGGLWICAKKLHQRSE